MAKLKVYPMNKLAEVGGGSIHLKHTPFGEIGAPVDFSHRDDYYLFSLICEGCGTASVDFTEITLNKNDGIIILPGQVHHGNAPGKMPLLWTLFLSPEHIAAPNQQKLEKYALGTAPIHFTDNEATDLRRLFGMLLHHADDMEFSTAMAMAIVRLYCNALTPGATHDKSRYSDITLRFKHMLDTWLSKEKRPSTYASMLNISPAYLNEAVKSATGLSASAFIRSRTMLEAKRQLAHTSRTVQEIAIDLGYDDSSYFSRFFKKGTGLSPTDFRKNLG